MTEGSSRSDRASGPQIKGQRLGQQHDERPPHLVPRAGPLKQETNGWAANRSERPATLKRTRTAGIANPQQRARRRPFGHRRRIDRWPGQSANSAPAAIIFLRRETEVKTVTAH